jgi:hypothetical protein
MERKGIGLMRPAGLVAYAPGQGLGTAKQWNFPEKKRENIK